MKNILIFAGLFLSFGFAAHAFAADGFTALAPIPGLTSPEVTSVVSQSGFANFFNSLYKYLIGLAAVLAIIEIIWAGISIAMHQDNVSSITASKGRIYNAIYGLILVLSPVLVFSIINPSILNLSLNLPPIKQITTPVASSGTGGGATTTPVPGGVAATAAGCTVTGTLLKTAACPTQQTAQDFAAACTTGTGSVSSSFYDLSTNKYKATCSTEKGSVTGPFQFTDTSSGWLATITGYSKYEPLASSGDAVLQFASACTTDGGTTCMSTIKYPCASLILSGGSVSCWNISLSCTDGSVGAGGCSSNPQFTVIK